MTKKQAIRYQAGDDLAPSAFLVWWGVFNAELSVRGLEHAGYGLARSMFRSGYTPNRAADMEAGEI